MRKVTMTAIEAFTTNTKKSCSSNTTVKNHRGLDTELYLHGHKIAIKNIMTGKIEISNCGWKSNTTKERLNGILSIVGGGISQKKGVWYLTTANGETVVMEPSKLYTIN